MSEENNIIEAFYQEFNRKDKSKLSLSNLSSITYSFGSNSIKSQYLINQAKELLIIEHLDFGKDNVSQYIDKISSNMFKFVMINYLYLSGFDLLTKKEIVSIGKNVDFVYKNFLTKD